MEGLTVQGLEADFPSLLAKTFNNHGSLFRVSEERIMPPLEYTDKLIVTSACVQPRNAWGFTLLFPQHHGRPACKVVVVQCRFWLFKAREIQD